jgi:hypothetical protein
MFRRAKFRQVHAPDRVLSLGDINTTFESPWQIIISSQYTRHVSSQKTLQKVSDLEQRFSYHFESDYYKEFVTFALETNSKSLTKVSDSLGRS